jgi:Carboxymuconolactone decarboxylase family
VGGPIDEIQPGDVVWTPPGVKHWHGASPDAAMTHIAISEHSGARSTEWMEHVTDAQYRAPVRGAAAAVGADSAAPTRGVTREELSEIITHLAFYAGWPNAIAAVGVAREVLRQD